MVTTSCVLNTPRCVTTVPRVHLHGSQGGVFVGHRPPRDPGDPPHIYIYIYLNNRSFTSMQMCHTHTRNIVKRNFVTQCHAQLLNTHTRLCHNSVVLCLTCVALRDIGAVLLRGRCGTWWHWHLTGWGGAPWSVSRCGCFVRQAWHFVAVRAHLRGAPWSVWCRSCFFHGTLWQSGCICVAGVAITLLCVARKLAVAWLRGRHGTCCWVAGEALGDTHTHTLICVVMFPPICL